MYDEDSDTYLLEGKKTWVANAASAQVFTVFAKTTVKNYMSEEEDSLSAFLVDLSDGGVTVGQPYPLTGYSGLQFSDVSFNCRGSNEISSKGKLYITSPSACYKCVG